MNPVRAACGIAAVVATIGIGGLIGWQRHWHALPLLGAAPPAILLLAWIALWLSDPVAVGYFAFLSFFTVFALVVVVYPISLALLGVGAIAGRACQRLARAK